MQTADALEQGGHVVIEGETGSGRRLLARSTWQRRTPGARSLFTLDCHMFGGATAEELLFGDHSGSNNRFALNPERFHLAMSGGLLLLHAEKLSVRAQTRLAQAIDPLLSRPRGTGMQMIVTCTPQPAGALPLYPGLANILLPVRMPPLRERIEDIRPIAESFLRNASPFERVHCSQALIDKFCAYQWPGNVTELRSVLRRLLLEAHHGLLDVRHVADLMCRDATCFALMQGVHSTMEMPFGVLQQALAPEIRSQQ
jgi:two-component system response regulator AtoC/two-component system response regulator HupR/HoxA